MFESAELGHKISKQIYARQEPKLRAALLNAQFDLAQAKKFPLLIVIGGVDGAGKGETVNLLNEWMDPRHIQTRAFGEASDEEAERPRMWRFWRELPPKGKIGIMFGSWYTDPIVRRVLGKSDDAELDASLEDIMRFEKMLCDEGVLLLKFWFHLSKKQQKTRMQELEKDPLTRWRVTKYDWERYKAYDAFRQISERALRETSSANASWTVVEGADERYRSLTVGKLLLDAMKKRLAKSNHLERRVQAPPLSSDNLGLLRDLDMTQQIAKQKYETQLEKWQGRLNLLSREKKYFKKHSLILLFEGSDAAGKGGAIRRITAAIDARHFQVVPVAAPTEEERAQPYLWRFWRHAPRRGRITIFDRSWYGRVLVERVEGFCGVADWMRAYGEINDFEEQMARSGAIVCKFWLQISAEEQLKRFTLRQKTSFKRFKITDEDWRNRKKWNEYEQAVCDMIDRTSTDIAPWTVVEAEDKYFARVKILKTIVERMERNL
ncbi:MAG: polyphosphate:AMP phosphotransferase [Betaproteobacteria bacterium]|nr:MAG: polyphosphate:AMP phosphotransferase [Betaproteobacteria bacterium]